jgi:hypothetical protein
MCDRTACLKQDTRSNGIIQKVLRGTWLKQIYWSRCGVAPPKCGDILQEESGWMTAYQLGHEAWPSCSDFTTTSDVGASACSMLDISMDGNPGIFDIMDRDESGELDRDEMESLHAEIEARRRVAEKEVWTRLHMSQRDLFKILPVVKGGSVATGIHGFEFASPHCSGVRECTDVRHSTTLRISSWSEWLGEYLRIGQRQHKNVTTCKTVFTETLLGIEETTMCDWWLELQPLSHLHVDGTVEGSCPLVLSGGSHSDKSSICIDKPKDARTLLLPDTSGMIITSETTHQISSLVGLRGDRTMQFTGEVHNRSRQWKYHTGFPSLDGGPKPPEPRINCAMTNCSAGEGGTKPNSTFEFGYESDVWYAVDSKVLRETEGKWLSNMPAYFSLPCPKLQPKKCDIMKLVEDKTIESTFGIKLQEKRGGGSWDKKNDGLKITQSPWPELLGDWKIAGESVSVYAYSQA